jgi:hypothetical protein
MFAVILQLAAIALGLWIGAATESWWVGLGSVAFLWLLALLAIGTVAAILGGPEAKPAKRFGEF